MYQQRYEFETLWNGISVTATPENLARIANNGKGNDNVWTVPNGNYVLKMSVLKANGDRSNPAHWEVWTSSVIRLARP